MFAILLIFITLIFLAVSVRKAGFLPFPTGLILFFAVSQVMLLLNFEDIVPYGMHVLYDFGGLQTNYTTVQLLYTSAAAITLLSLSGKFRLLRSMDITGAFGKILNAKNKSRFRASLITVLLCCVHLIFYLLVSNWHDLWLYHEYLFLGRDATWVNIFGSQFSDTVMRTMPLWAIISCLCVCGLIGTRHTFLKLVANALNVSYFLLLLSQHSRAAAFVPALIAINYTILRLKGRRIMVPAMVLLAVITLMGALEGRNTDQHGLSTLPETIWSPFASSDPFYEISQALMDFCQGTVVTAESLQLTSDFNLEYKILAFSPFPSFIDGYSSIRDASEHRLHEFVPMSAIGEVFHFGLLYQSVLLLYLVVIVRAHTRIITKNPAIFILCNFLITFSIYMMFSYPVRNALRYYWIAAALVVIGDLSAKRRLARDRNNALRRDNELNRLQQSFVSPSTKR